MHSLRGAAPYNPRCRCQWLTAFKELMMSQENFEFAFFRLFRLEMVSNFRKTAIFHLWTTAVFFLNPFSAGILWKIGIKKKVKHPTLNDYISKTRTNLESKLNDTAGGSSCQRLAAVSCQRQGAPAVSGSQHSKS